MPELDSTQAVLELTANTPEELSCSSGIRVYEIPGLAVALLLTPHRKVAPMTISSQPCIKRCKRKFVTEITSSDVDELPCASSTVSVYPFFT